MPRSSPSAARQRRRRHEEPTTALAVLLAAFGTFAEDLSEMQLRATSAETPLERLKAIHEGASTLGMARNAFADAKGLACLEANEAGLSYPTIAAALQCSEPYVQQMVYRGRKVRS